MKMYFVKIHHHQQLNIKTNENIVVSFKWIQRIHCRHSIRLKYYCLHTICHIHLLIFKSKIFWERSHIFNDTE